MVSLMLTARRDLRTHSSKMLILEGRKLNSKICQYFFTVVVVAVKSDKAKESRGKNPKQSASLESAYMLRTWSSSLLFSGPSCPHL